MRLKLICCDVFARLAYKTAAESPHLVDLELLPMLAHNEPDKLRASLQEAIDRACNSQDKYERLILAYGLCGNATAGLTSSIPLIIPRMHDCCAMFLGSQEKFLEDFSHRLSANWRTCGYMERCKGFYMDAINQFQTNPEYLKLVEEYGEDNASYVWETLHPTIENAEGLYIEIDGYEYGSTKADYINQMQEEGCPVETIQGNAAWFIKMVNGPWDTSLFLELSPGCKIEPVYDMKEVFR